MKNKLIVFLGVILFIQVACNPIKTNPVEEPESEYGTGTLYEKELTSLATIPSDLSVVTLEDVENAGASLSHITLEKYVPPVLSQGQYGTCTAWATGYYARTIMYAREHNLTATDLQDKSNVFSPKYLFLAIPGENKGENCNGSWPGAAFKIMQTRGIATLDEVPYDNLGTCGQSIPSDWDNNAEAYKIENYRKIDPKDIASIKSYISMGRPIQISCELGLNFSHFKGSGVLYDDDYSAEPEKHGRHAMCLIGYDDDKGDNGAFRVVNSWGTNWGDNGFFWVDYKFFADKFCYAGYVLEGDKGGLSEGMINEEIINPNYLVDGKDLITVRFTDEDNPDSNSDRDRRLTYNVFNKGKEQINASEDWNIIYYYYNAFDPENDFGIIVYDYYTDDVGAAYKGQNGDFADLSTNMKEYGAFNWWNYVDVPSGYSVARAVGGDGYDYDFEYDYTMPDITGKYYLVMMADGFNALDEQFEQNNFIFLTGKDKAPLNITNGVITDIPQKSSKENTVYCNELKKAQANAYNIDEISKLIKYQQRTGKLQKRARELKALKSNRNTKKLVKARLARN